MLKTSNLLMNDVFFGQFHAHRLDRRDLSRFIISAGEGITEIGCHPGHYGDNIKSERPWYYLCEKELMALCDPRFKEEIANNSLKLVSYAQVV
jgi:predicted glycoside hydrolase/deacetylase ChbG (UPF0249 family)